jgi:hypothetical protein
MNWSFAIINNKLAEIYFERKKNGDIKFLGHCYVKREEYKTKKEQKYIDDDIARTKLLYRKGDYKRILLKALALK